MRDVWVTGYGMVSALGNNPDLFFQSLLDEQCAIEMIPEWKELKGLQSHLAAKAKDVNVSHLPRITRRTMNRMSEMAYLATRDAIAMANIVHSADPSQRAFVQIPKSRIAFIFGSTGGSSETMLQYFGKYIQNKGPVGQQSTSFFKCMSHTVLANVMGALQIQAPALSVSSACATSTHAAILGHELIAAGIYDIVITGGADELHDTAAAIFDTVLAACRNQEDPKKSIRPFDSKRSGLAVSEGAGVLILEAAESARRRGVTAKAKFLGGAYSMDGDHMAQPRAESMKACMQTALEKSACSVDSIDYVNAHATSTMLGDAEEAKAIAATFGKEAPVSSLKGHLGHSLAACGAIEMIAIMKMFDSQKLIPTLNLESVDGDCAEIQHVKSQTPARALNRVLTNNFAFGGVNTCAILERVL